MHWEFDHQKQQMHVNDLSASANSSSQNSGQRRFNFTSNKLVPNYDTGDLQVPDYVEVEVPLLPIFREQVPQGISIFQTKREFKECIECYQKLADRYTKHINKLNAELNKDEEREEEIKFPVPATKHTFCGVCQTNYQDYKSHIKSLAHLSCVESDDLYLDIDELIL